jgi:hypothetical protein
MVLKSTMEQNILLNVPGVQGKICKKKQYTLKYRVCNDSCIKHISYRYSIQDQKYLSTCKCIVFAIYRSGGTVRRIYWITRLRRCPVHFKRTGTGSKFSKLRTQKTESMTMVGCRAVHRISDGAYNRMITRQGPTNAEIKKIMTKCTNCEVEVQNGSLKKQMLSKRCLNHKADFNQQDMVCIPIIEMTTDTFVISMDDDNTQCPHQDCPYTTTKRERMHKYFRSRHLEDIIIILQEGLLPQCNNCGIFQKNALTERHTSSLECRHHSKTKRKIKKELIQPAASNVKFTVEEVPITSSFKYLGQIITEKDDDLPAVVAQINKSRQIWARISRILKKKTDSNIKITATFYKVIV